MLGSAKVNPKLSAWEYLFGIFDYRKTPIVPPGTKLIAHTKPSQRSSWEFNGQEGLSIGISPEHYRCIKCYLPKKCSGRDLDTVTFFPADIDFPKISIEDYLQQAALDIITILTDPPNNTIPTLSAGNKTRNALLELVTILKNRSNLPALSNTAKP